MHFDRMTLHTLLLHACDDSDMSLKVLRQFSSFHQALQQSLLAWPSAVQSKVNALIAAKLLEFAGKIALDLKSLNIHLPQLHPAAQRHFKDKDE